MSALDDFCAARGVPFHEAGDADRAAILRRLGDTELFVALAAEPRDDTAELLRLDLGEGAEAALACDDDGRLAAVLGRPVAHLALPGREVARMLASEGLALLVNPGAASELLLDAASLRWLSEALATAPQAEAARFEELTAPDPAVVAALAGPLGERLADMAGMVRAAVLVSAREAGGKPLHLLVLQGAAEAARAPLAKAMAELLAFLPPLPQPVDVIFADAISLPPGAVTIRLEALPQPAPAAPAPPAEPKPPRLRW